MLIEKIKSPKDVKVLSREQLHELAGEMRTVLLNKVSQHGGHVGPNLGFLEATIAMHYVFDAPRDKFVFDVSHQTYPHKMLTGRAYGFLDPKEYDDVSGFSSPTESPVYDMFEVGHTSTGISLASGLQKARDINGGHENVVVVIGDGSLSGGEAFEGLDTSAETGTNFIVIVNDNEMSIAENHGGLYGNLALLRSTRGQAQCNYFRAMGFDYKYVEEGNNIDALISAFESVKDIDHPIVVHIHTEKGHGYKYAVERKEEFHYHVPFYLETGETRNPDTAEDYSELTGKFLLDEMKRDPKLVAVTAGTPSVCGFGPEERRQAGKQFVDVGIAEEQAVAMVSGMAKGGAHPVFNVFSTFMQRTYDQIAQDLCVNGNPAVINVFLGSIFGMNDITHIGFFDIAMIGNIPNLVYLAPTCYEEYMAMERWAIAQTNHSVAIRVPGGSVVHSREKFDESYDQINRFKTMHSGSRVAIVALGAFYPLGEKVAQGLKEKLGIEATLINPRFASGIDEELLEGLKANHQVVITLEDGVLEGGFGEKVARFFGPSLVRTRCYGVKKALYDRYDYQKMLIDNHLTPEQMVADVEELLKQ